MHRCSDDDSTADGRGAGRRSQKRAGARDVDPAVIIVGVRHPVKSISVVPISKEHALARSEHEDVVVRAADGIRHERGMRQGKRRIERIARVHGKEAAHLGHAHACESKLIGAEERNPEREHALADRNRLRQSQKLIRRAAWKWNDRGVVNDHSRACLEGKNAPQRNQRRQRRDLPHASLYLLELSLVKKTLRKIDRWIGRSANASAARTDVKFDSAPSTLFYIEVRAGLALGTARSTFGLRRKAAHPFVDLDSAQSLGL